MHGVESYLLPTATSVLSCESHDEHFCCLRKSSSDDAESIAFSSTMPRIWNVKVMVTGVSKHRQVSMAHTCLSSFKLRK